MKSLTSLIACIGFLLAVQPVAAVEVEGFQVPESIQLDGQPLLRNGVAIRKLAVFKMEVASLYLTSLQNSLEGVTAVKGPKRLRLVMLRDVPSQLLSRKFLHDFQSVSTAVEWGALANEVTALNAMFAATGGISKGDIVTLDWLPEKGLSIALNGKQLSAQPLNNELVYQIILRIFLGPDAQASAREQLLGLKPVEG